MAIEHANSFVNRLFEDDVFLTTIIEKRGYANGHNANQETENKEIVRIANEMGFQFDVEEFKEACKTYMSEFDGWEAAQKVFHVLKVVSRNYRKNNY